MILHPKNKKTVGVIWMVLAILMAISMIASYSLPFLLK